jgi:hypothetical protein
LLEALVPSQAGNKGESLQALVPSIIGSSNIAERTMQWSGAGDTAFE